MQPLARAARLQTPGPTPVRACVAENSGDVPLRSSQEQYRGGFSEGDCKEGNLFWILALGRQEWGTYPFLDWDTGPEMSATLEISPCPRLPSFASRFSSFSLRPVTQATILRPKVSSSECQKYFKFVLTQILLSSPFWPTHKLVHSAEV